MTDTLSNDIFLDSLAMVEEANFDKDGSSIVFPSGALKETLDVKSVLIVVKEKTNDWPVKIGFHAKEKGFKSVAIFNADDLEVVTTQLILGNYRFENTPPKPKPTWNQ